MSTARNRHLCWIIFGCMLATVTTWVIAVPEPPSGAIPGFPKLSARNDWPWWRGPTHDGVVSVGQSPPLQWSETENILWSCPVPGRGHGSVTVVGNQVFLATADVDHGVQLVISIDRSNGRMLWRTAVHQGGLETTKGNAKSTLASSTIASDGRRLFINFLNAGAVYATALTLEGEKIWQAKVNDFEIHQGYGASPLLHGSLVIVSADNKGGGAIAALDQTTGKVVWKNERPAKANYTSPILLKVSGQEQLLFSGCDLVTSLDPNTGHKIWETEGSTTECVTSIVSDGERVFTSGGYPRNHMSAIRADSTGKIDWENTTRVYVPSMIVRDGYLYAVLDAGFAACWKCATGEEMWKERIGGTFSSSLVLVGENLMATNEAGQTSVFKADPGGFVRIAESQLGDECFATPAVCGNRIYHRVARQVDGKRQEFVYCIGKP